MKLKIQKSELSLATARTQGATSDRSLAHIGLKAADGQLKVCVSDRVLIVYSSLEAEISEEGCIFVPARLFSDVVRELPDGFVSLICEQNFLVIKAGVNDEFIMKLPGIEDKEWRDAPAIASFSSTELPTEKVQYMIDQIQLCVAQESPRNYGAVGFLHKPNSSTLRLVGTDGFRLSYSEVQVPLPEDFLEEGVCLSKRALNELQRMCGEGYDRLSIFISKDQTILTAFVPGYEIFVRLSSVKYPNYQGVLPSQDLVPVDVSRPYLQSVAKRVLLAADKTRALQLCFSESSLTLSSRTLGSSEGTESINLQGYLGGDRELAVNGKFLTDVFSTIGSDEITINFKSVNDPIVLIPKMEPEKCKSMHVLVPIRETN